jgi:hypothetical protein
MGDVDATGGSWTSPTKDAVARPERPDMSDQTPPPVSGKAAVPDGLRKTQAILYTGVTLVFFGVVVMIMTRSSLVSSLVDELKSQDPTFDIKKLNEAAPLIIYAAIAALLMVAVPEWLVATRIIRRRRWPRILLVPLAIAHLLVVAVCAVLIPTTGWQGMLLLAALVVSGLLALAASVRTFTRSMSAWLTTPDEDGQAAG